MKPANRKPRAFRVAGEEQPQPAGNRPPAEEPRRPRAVQEAMVEIVPDDLANGWVEDLNPPPAPPPRRRFSWMALLLTGLGGLVSLAIGLAVDQFIRGLFERNVWLGWLAAGLAGLVVLGAVAIAARELIGLMRQRAIHRLQARGAEADASDDARLARAVIADLASLYGSRADTARGKALLAGHEGEIIDGSDLIALAERDLLAPLDRKAATMVMNSAKRVSVVTAVSPRALIDIAYVLGENLRLVRRLSELYGGRPGTIGFFRLTRDVLAHLAATGAIALGDSLIQQIVGHGIAARLSAKLGEGVVNGLLTARVGIAAMEVCRPLPFRHEARPGVSQFLSELVRLNAPRPEGGAPAGHETDKSAKQ